MDVAVHYRSSPDAAEATAADCRALGVRAHTVAGDLSVSAECRRVVREAGEALGGLDALVASASTWEPRAFDEIDDEHIERALAVNVRAPLIMAQEATPLLRASGRGRIVLMNDVAGIEPWPRFMVHSVSKAGLGMLTRALAQELAPDVTVNAIAPGTVLMPDGASDAAARRSAEKSVLQRLGSPDDVAAAMRYLLEADYVTGHTLVVDGGRLVRP
jgi:NAD(P)-dependent dehydrogenase (short-subunit alcohol dehydrogenase family)